MKYFLQFSLTIALLVAAQSLYAQDSYRYKGTIGTMKVSMNFTNQWSDYFTSYTGAYSYDKVGVDISLRGCWLGRTESIELVEVAEDSVTGFFSLKLDPKESVNLLTGTWTSLDKKRSYPVRLVRQQQGK